MALVEDGIAAALSLHGEAFMRMFDDSDADEREPGPTTANGIESTDHRKAATEHKANLGSNPSGHQARKKGKKNTLHGRTVQQPQAATAASKQLHDDVAATASADGLAGRKRENEIDEVFRERKKKKKLATLTKPDANGHVGVGTSSTLVRKGSIGLVSNVTNRQGSHHQASTSGGRDVNGNVGVKAPHVSRRNFFSDKVAKVHSVPEDAITRAEPDDSMEEYSEAMLKAEFAMLQHEVEVFGGSLLGKKDKKKWKVNYLSKLGVKTKTGVKTAASIGLGRAVKAAQVKAREEEEAVRAGMKLSKREQALLKKKKQRTGGGAGGTLGKKAIVKKKKK